MKPILLATFFLFLAGARSLVADTWAPGATALLSSAPGTHIRLPGSSEPVTFEGAGPHYLPGLLSVQATRAGQTLMHASNGVNLYFEGEGFYGIERFESLFRDGSPESADDGAALSRMILNLRRGLLVVDSRSLSAESRFVLEAPFGRVFGARALWLIAINFDQRSGIYDITLACSEGNIRLIDLQGESYPVYPGQRIAGAGNYLELSIEVGDQTATAREAFGNFNKLLADFDLEALDRSALNALMAAAPQAPPPAIPPVNEERATDKYPIVIDFTPRPRPVTPFRGVRAPPPEASP